MPGTLTLAELDEAIAEVRANLRDLVEQETARSGAEDEAEARALAATITLERAVRHIDTPLLVVGSGHDTIAPAWHQERLASQVKSAELVVYPDGSHGVTNRAYESRSRMADWLAAKLTA